MRLSPALLPVSLLTTVLTATAWEPAARRAIHWPPAVLQAPVVDLATANPGADIERSACVSVALRPNLAYECGDLRATFAYPVIRTFNKPRSVTMVYNSQHARPTPIVRVWVTNPASGTTPTTVTATLFVLQAGSYVQRASQAWGVSAWYPGQQRQMALSFDATDLPTGLYPYRLEITFSDGSGAQTTAATGDLAIVNRSTSEFGAGWWVAGYERVIPLPNGDVFWVGGDGSTRRYVKQQYVGPNGWTVFKARTLAGSDSMTYSPTGGGYWFRHLQRAVYTRFDSTGRHINTVNTAGHVTNFLTYFGCNRLVHIQLPLPAGYPGYLAFTFNYDKDATPTPCVGQAKHYNSGVSETPNNTWRTVTRSIGAATGGFNFAGDSLSYTESDGRITSWTDSRGVRTTVVYEAGGLVTSARTPAGVGSDSVIQAFRAGEGAALASPDAAGNLYTALYSPRADVLTPTKVWLGPWGNPLTITDPAGRTTSILPDATFPLLTKRVTNPAGWSQYALYNSDGKLTYMNADPVGGTGTPEWYYRYLDATYPDNGWGISDDH